MTTYTPAESALCAAARTVLTEQCIAGGVIPIPGTSMIVAFGEREQIATLAAPSAQQAAGRIGGEAWDRLYGNHYERLKAKDAALQAQPTAVSAPTDEQIDAALAVYMAAWTEHESMAQCKRNGMRAVLNSLARAAAPVDAMTDVTELRAWLSKLEDEAHSYTGAQMFTRVRTYLSQFGYLNAVAKTATSVSNQQQADVMTILAKRTNLSTDALDEVIPQIAAIFAAPVSGPTDARVDALYMRIGADAISAAPVSGQGASVLLTVMVERNRVWIKRGVQSFMLAYEADTEQELNWYADRLRGAMTNITPCVKTWRERYAACEPCNWEEGQKMQAECRDSEIADLRRYLALPPGKPGPSYLPKLPEAFVETLGSGKLYSEVQITSYGQLCIDSRPRSEDETLVEKCRQLAAELAVANAMIAGARSEDSRAEVQRDPARWYVWHNNQEAEGANLMEVLRNGKNLRTEEEALAAGQNVMAALEQERPEEMMERARKEHPECFEAGDKLAGLASTTPQKADNE